MHMTPPTAPARFAGLDGLRAVAVLLVVVYHLFPGGWLPGGFVGVDVFFVISGFLITTLLLRERAAAGRIRLGVFWRRRARRLLPALLALLAICSTFAWLIGGDVLARLGPQLLGAVTFSYNWVSIASGSGYFDASSPELFRNLWSLAVEEQFYVLWPLLLPLVLLLPRTRWRVALAVGVGALSAVWMGVVVLAGGDLTRAYFGTDTHAFGLLAGVALAFCGHGMRGRAPAWSGRRPVRVGVGLAGAAALVGLVGVATIPETPTLASFPGAILAAVALSAVVIVAGAWPGTGIGRMLDVAPLRWIGDRSYGVYLWHWPLLVLLVAATGGSTGDVPVGLGLLVLALTFAIAELSARLLETPVRRHGFRGALRGLRSALLGSPGTRFGAIAGVAVGAVFVGGASAAIAAAPAATSSQAVVEAGAAALAAASPAPGDRPPPPAGPSPRPVTGDQVTAIGDSVMLASAPGLLARLPGIQVDAEVSRSMWAAPRILRDLSDRGQLRPFVVVALGTNGPVDADDLDDIRRTVGPDRCLVLVNAFAPRDWIDGVNGELRAFADAHPGVEVADWAGTIGGRPDLLAGDRIHPRPSGGDIFAGTVATALDAAERERATKEYDDELRARALNAGIRLREPQ
jgi:peptidoglycan/LPS O-acetylase OafA/YrhL